MSKTIKLSVLVCVSAFCIFVGSGKSQDDYRPNSKVKKAFESNCETSLRLYRISLSNRMKGKPNPYIIEENTYRVPSSPADRNSNKREYGMAIEMDKDCEFVFDKKVIGKNVKELPADTVVVYCKKHKHHKILAKEFQD